MREAERSSSRCARQERFVWLRRQATESQIEQPPQIIPRATPAANAENQPPISSGGFPTEWPKARRPTKSCGLKSPSERMSPEERPAPDTHSRSRSPQDGESQMLFLSEQPVRATVEKRPEKKYLR